MRELISCYLLAVILAIFIGRAILLNTRRVMIGIKTGIKWNKQADKELGGRFRRTYQKIQGTANIALRLDILLGAITLLTLGLFLHNNGSSISLNHRHNMTLVIMIVQIVVIGQGIISTRHDKIRLEILCNVVALGRRTRLEEVKLGTENETLTKNDLTRINKECIKLYELLDKTKTLEQLEENREKIEAKLEFIESMKNDLVASNS